MTENKDYSYHCADCDNYGLCNYYHRRKSTSKICKEFQNKLKMIGVLKEIKAEIADLPNDNPSYWHVCYVLEREKVLDIIDKHLKEYED